MGERLLEDRCDAASVNFRILASAQRERNILDIRMLEGTLADGFQRSRQLDALDVRTVEAIPGNRIDTFRNSTVCQAFHHFDQLVGRFTRPLVAKNRSVRRKVVTSMNARQIGTVPENRLGPQWRSACLILEIDVYGFNAVRQCD